MSKPILLVSDDGGPGRELKRALQKSAANFAIECAATRAEIAARRHPCLIVLDLKLSSEPASAVLNWLRNEPLYQDVPVFVLGCEAAKSEIGEAFRLGATSCFLAARGQINPIADGIATYVSLLVAPSYAAG